ncbi:MAG: GTP 3',8-cyclase MoaA [Desulfurococcales archaeon]
MKDKFNRCVNSYRLVVTMRCNYSCIFCHREGITSSRRSELMDPQDYGFLTRISVKLGVSEYKITGGEPLVRDDIGDIVKEISEAGGNVTMTSNGSLLNLKAKELAEGGLKRINVSLHSLREDTYGYLTGGSRSLDVVLKGINEALEYGIRVKLDFVLMKSNAGELKNIIDFASNIGADLNIIELIPLGTPNLVYSKEHYETKEVLSLLESESAEVRIKEFQNRPSFKLSTGIEVTVVKGYGNPSLCEGCTRLRVTPDAKFKTCLFVEDPYIDFLRPLKMRDEVALRDALRKAVEIRKPFFTKEGSLWR